MPLTNAKKVFSGDLVNVTNGGTSVPQFDIVQLGTDLRGFATSDFAASAAGTIDLEGILELPSATSLTIAAGAVAYYDETNNQISQVVTDLPIGWVVKASTDATTQQVRLDPSLRKRTELTIPSGSTSGTVTVTGARAGEHYDAVIMAQGATVVNVTSVAVTANTVTVTVSANPGTGGVKMHVGRSI